MRIVPVFAAAGALAALVAGAPARAYEPVSPEVMVAEAEGLIATGDVAGALPLLEHAGRNWYPDADVRLGQMYLDGELVGQDVDRAIAHLDRAATPNWIRQLYKRGHPEAQHRLAAVYLSREVGPYDAGEAFGLLRAAARLGHADAQLALARLYAAGEGTAADDEEAYRWAVIARRTGDATVREEADALAASLRERLATPATRRIEREAAAFVPAAG